MSVLGLVKLEQLVEFEMFALGEKLLEQQLDFVEDE